MFNFNNTDIKFRKAQLPFLFLAFAPIFLHDVDLSRLFKSAKKAPNISPVTAQAIIEGKAIKLEVANNAATQASGLTYRNDIDIDRGMLYEVNVSQPLIFTGEGMKFSTDLIFIMGDKVVGFYSDVKPCSGKDCIKYSFDPQYNRVLEVKTGIAQQLGVKNDTQVNISFLTKR
jgi:uncharacterized protein